MKRTLKILLLIICPVYLNAQNNLGSLKNVFANATNDSARYYAARNLYTYYEELNRDSALYYAKECLSLSEKNNKKLNEATAFCQKAYQELNLGQFGASLQSLLAAFKIAEDKKSEKNFWRTDTVSSASVTRLTALAYTHHIYGVLMWRTQNAEEEIIHFKEAKRIGEEINNKVRMLLANMNLGRAYTNIGKLDSALLFEKNAEAISLSSGFLKYLAFIFYQQGIIYLKKGDIGTAKKYFYESLESGREQNNLSAMGRSYHELTKLYFDQKDKDSSLYYAKKSIEALNALGSLSGTEFNLGIAYDYLHKVYQLRDQFDSSYKYQGLALVIKDSLYNSRIKNLAEFQNLTLGEKLRLQNLEKEKVVYQNKVRIYFLLGGIAVLLLLAIIFYRNNRQKHKAKLKIEKAYDDLKATQQQLVQAEKMASLGELTAGIAHEIQNPLNFVNNFSELNAELAEELKSELATGNVQQAAEIASSIKDNEEKINFHGKRADAIVKSMLLHSRASSGKKEPVDINALADEYLRLAYHGLRAKDKSFNAKFETDFDGGIGKINVLPQDMGRVILNLITNAFYSVTEKKKLSGDEYEPTVGVSTKKTGDKVEIKVTDNGTGIPQKSLEKIFQPFYTTKPTGEGTGLGLSLSYDIVTKGHGGDLKVRNKEGEGAEFIITLPY